MQQRRLRLGDILDDYCPRERRITNHAVVAMIEDTVKQTRCTTCDAEHEYKEAKVPAARRRKSGPIEAHLVEGSNRPADVAGVQSSDESPIIGDAAVDDIAEVAETIQPEVGSEGELTAAPAPDQPEAEPLEDTGSDQDEWPDHRPLIRATLPRIEGQKEERRPTDFTIRQSNGRGSPHGNFRGGNERSRPGRGHGGNAGSGGHGGNRGNGFRSHGGSRFAGARPGQGQGRGQGGGFRSGQQQRQGGGRKRSR